MEKYIERADHAANICHLMVGSQTDNSAKVILYRAACIALDAVMLVDIVSNLMPTQDFSYFDEDDWEIIGDKAEARMWEAKAYKEIGEASNISRRCVSAAAEAIESSVDLYIIAQGKLAEATEKNWGSILDRRTITSTAILSAYEAFEDTEEVYQAAEYSHAVPAYWASYEALRAAQLLIESRNPKAVKLQPYLFNIDHMHYLIDMYRQGAMGLFEIFNESASPAALVAADSAVKAFVSAQEAIELAIGNLRAARLLERETDG